MRKFYYVLGALVLVLSAAGVNMAGAATKVTLCHETGSLKNPFEVIAVSDNAVAAHVAHGDDLNRNPYNNCQLGGDPVPE